MATTKNITMKQFNGTDYDTLYPKTKIEQVEGAYTQQQILADSTKGLFGLNATAVPDDALALLSRFHKGLGNEYVWAKTKTEIIEQEDSLSNVTFWSGNSGTQYTLYYADSVTKQSNGTYVLNSPASAEFYAQSGSSYANNFKGKYVCAKVGYGATSTNSPNADGVYYIPADAAIRFVDPYPSSGPYSFVASSAIHLYGYKEAEVSYGYVNSPDPNAYEQKYIWQAKYTELSSVDIYLKNPSSAVSTIKYCDSLEIDPSTGEFIPVNLQTFSGNYSDFNSKVPDLLGKYVYISDLAASNSEQVIPNWFYLPSDCRKLSGSNASGYVVYVAYTSSLIKQIEAEKVSVPFEDGYTYTALGQLGNKARVETGSYTGTGTSSSAGRISLTFDFKPKVVFIKSATSNVGGYAWIYGTSKNQAMTGLSSEVYTSWDGKTLSWYSTDGTNPMLNNSGETYYYIAIG